VSPRTLRDGGSLCVVYVGDPAPSPRLNPSRQPSSEAPRSAITTASVFARLRWGWLCLDQQYHYINAANIPTKIAPNSVAFRHTYLLAPTAGLQALINYRRDDCNATKDGTKDYRRNCLVWRDCILHSHRQLAAITTLASRIGESCNGQRLVTVLARTSCIFQEALRFQHTTMGSAILYLCELSHYYTR
jgi:hypothetical protein